MARVIVAGSVVMDVVARAARHPRPGETVVGDSLAYYPGGKGANQAIAAARLGVPTRLIGMRGDDDFGERLARYLREADVDTDTLLCSPEQPTGTSLIVLDADAENTIVMLPGANAGLRPSHLNNVDFGSDDLLLVQLEIPLDTVEELLHRGRAAGARTILNAAPFHPGCKSLLPITDYLIVNELELAALAGKEKIELPPTTQHLRRLLKQCRAFPAQTLVVTLGAEGLYCLGPGGEWRISGHKVRAVDTVGAGDCFVGAFAVALAEGRSCEEALRFANAAAASSVEQPGAAPSMPGRASLSRWLAERKISMLLRQ